MEIYNKADALAILQQADGHGGYVGWNEEQRIPDTSSGTIILDGAFSKSELLAILFFFADQPAFTKNASACSKNLA